MNPLLVDDRNAKLGYRRSHQKKCTIRNKNRPRPGQRAHLTLSHFSIMTRPSFRRRRHRRLHMQTSGRRRHRPVVTQSRRSAARSTLQVHELWFVDQRNVLDVEMDCRRDREWPTTSHVVHGWRRNMFRRHIRRPAQRSVGWGTKMQPTGLEELRQLSEEKRASFWQQPVRQQERSHRRSKPSHPPQSPRRLASIQSAQVALKTPLQHHVAKRDAHCRD